MRRTFVCQCLGLLLIGTAVAKTTLSETRYQHWLDLRIAPPHVSEAPDARPDPNLEGKVVHLTARLSGESRDPELGVSVPALMLHRQVEECVSLPGKRPRWKTVLENAPGLSSKKFYPDQVHIGGFLLPPSALSLKHRYANLTIQPQASLPSPEARWHGNVFYLSGRIQNPQPKDRKVTFRVLPLPLMSVVGQQSHGGLQPVPGRHQALWIREGRFSTADYLKAESWAQPPPWDERVRAALYVGAGLLLLAAPWLASRLKPRLKEDPID